MERGTARVEAERTLEVELRVRRPSLELGDLAHGDEGLGEVELLVERLAQHLVRAREVVLTHEEPRALVERPGVGRIGLPGLLDEAAGLLGVARDLGQPGQRAPGLAGPERIALGGEGQLPPRLQRVALTQRGHARGDEQVERRAAPALGQGLGGGRRVAEGDLVAGEQRGGQETCDRIRVLVVGRDRTPKGPGRLGRVPGREVRMPQAAAGQDAQGAPLGVTGLTALGLEQVLDRLGTAPLVEQEAAVGEPGEVVGPIEADRLEEVLLGEVEEPVAGLELRHPRPGHGVRPLAALDQAAVEGVGLLAAEPGLVDLGQLEHGEGIGLTVLPEHARRELGELDGGVEQARSVVALGDAEVDHLHGLHEVAGPQLIPHPRAEQADAVRGGVGQRPAREALGLEEHGREVRRVDALASVRLDLDELDRLGGTLVQGVALAVDDRAEAQGASVGRLEPVVEPLPGGDALGTLLGAQQLLGVRAVTPADGEGGLALVLLLGDVLEGCGRTLGQDGLEEAGRGHGDHRGPQQLGVGGDPEGPRRRRPERVQRRLGRRLQAEGRERSRVPRRREQVPGEALEVVARGQGQRRVRRGEGLELGRAAAPAAPAAGRALGEVAGHPPAQEGGGDGEDDLFLLDGHDYSSPSSASSWRRTATSVMSSATSSSRPLAARAS